ncbi:MAG: tetratricopeptide repeat protein [Bacteroidales bacterium]|nr:tetratricopeptide repeat protein [Bacteroidales bacterium]
MKKFLLTIAILLLGATFATAQYDKDVFMWRGRQALSDGKYALAIENFNILSRLDSTDYWSFFFRGIAKYNLGDLRGAQNDFNSSVRLNPVFTNGFHYRAITESRFGDYEAAFRDFDRALELRPGQIGIYFSRGVANFLAQKFDDAVSDFDYYIKKEPRDPAAYLNRGACHLFLADTTRALEDYNRAIRLDRTEPEGFVRRARVYASQKRYDEAVDDLDHAISLDRENTFAYFNRALIYYEQKRYNEAVSDLNTVLEHEPGNALTLYNRSLIYAQVGAFDQALEDMDRVININPGNVLAHYNRAAIFVEMGRWQDALEDYNKSIELYPDFAKAYLNRSYVENMLGRMRESRADYQTAQQKVRDYRARSGEASFADTTRQYSSLLALDADFAKKDFDNELLQHRDIDIRLRPLYKFSLTEEKENRNVALSRQYENALIDRFIDAAPTPITLGNSESSGTDRFLFTANAEEYFVKGLQELQRKQYNSALGWFDRAVGAAEDDVSRDRYARYYKAFYLMNRGVLKAEMIDFIASLEGSVQTLSMDTEGSTRARVSDRVARTYDYSEAIADIREALSILPDIPYLYFDLGNLECLSSNFVEALDNYDMAIRLYPNMGDAYYNRGLVLIYLKDKEKGCIDLSRAGELGVADSYSVISKYCAEDENN